MEKHNQMEHATISCIGGTYCVCVCIVSGDYDCSALEESPPETADLLLLLGFSFFIFFCCIPLSGKHATNFQGKVFLVGVKERLKCFQSFHIHHGLRREFLPKGRRNRTKYKDS